MPHVECPKCAEWVNVTADDIGRMVNCGSCGAVFPAIETSETEDEYERRTENDEANRLLQWPSRALVKLSVFSIIGSCIIGASYFIYGFSGLRFLGRNNQESTSLMILGILTAVLGSLYSLLILIGASRMHDPRQRNWPIFSAIAATAAILFCWPIPILNILLCIFGIIAWRRLFHPAVKEAARPEWDRELSEESAYPEDILAYSGSNEAHSISAYFSDEYEPIDPDERAAVVAEAQRRARVPGMGLMVTGIVGMAVALLIGLGMTLTRLANDRSDLSGYLITVGYFIAVAFYFVTVQR